MNNLKQTEKLIKQMKSEKDYSDNFTITKEEENKKLYQFMTEAKMLSKQHDEIISKIKRIKQVVRKKQITLLEDKIQAMKVMKGWD